MKQTSQRLGVLFVCMGNICRSPTAHGVFENYVRDAGLEKHIYVDSAGTHAYHINEAPDPRSQQHPLSRGYDLSHLRARQLSTDDFHEFHLILVMDWENYALAEKLAPAGKQHKLRRLTEFCKVHQASVVPDPYYKGAEGFEEVLDLVEDACDGLLEHMQARLRQFSI